MTDEGGGDVVKRSEAPPPGWYPDPTGRSGLLWWDGRDWTRHHRPAPAASSYVEPATAEDGEDGEGGGPAVPTANQLRSRGGARQRRESEREIADAVAEARRVAKAEVERAVSQATRRLTDTRQRWQPRLEEYGRRLKRWLRTTVIVVVVVVGLWTWASATLQTNLLEWLGQRIDAATATISLPVDHQPSRSAR